MKDNPPDKAKNNSKKSMDAYMSYSGMAIQMVLYIGVGILIGSWIDSYFELEKKIFTGMLPIVFMAGYLYKLFIDLSPKK